MKKKKVTAKMIKNAIANSTFTEKVELLGEELEIEVKKAISATEMVAFVNSVFDAATIDGVYYDALFEYSYHLHLISTLTNLELPEDLTGAEAFVLEAYNVIFENGYWEHGEDLDTERFLREACENERQVRLKVKAEQETPAGVAVREIVDWLTNLGSQLTSGVTSEDIEVIKNIFGAAGNTYDVSPQDIAAGLALLSKETDQDKGVKDEAD